MEHHRLAVKQGIPEIERAQCGGDLGERRGEIISLREISRTDVPQSPRQAIAIQLQLMDPVGTARTLNEQSSLRGVAAGELVKGNSATSSLEPILEKVGRVLQSANRDSTQRRPGWAGLTPHKVSARGAMTLARSSQ
jgi:hypothetical protein